MSKKILWAWRSGGFTSGIVEGPRGIGKSGYAMNILHDVFLCQGYHDEVAWDMALDRMLYRITDIINFLDKSTRKRKPETMFVWDDAAVFGSSMTYFSDFKMVHLLQAMMDTIRGSVSGMILTCPNQGQLLKFLRRYDAYIIRINYVEEGGYNRVAKGYLWRSLPSGLQRIYPNFHDFYSCRLPNDIFERYQRRRKKYNIENIRALKEAVKEQQEGKNMSGGTVIVEEDNKEEEVIEGDDIEGVDIK